MLLIAEAANPDWVSVPLEGWAHSRAIANLIDGHLVTQVRNRKAVKRQGLIEEQDFTVIDSERLARPLWRIASVIRGGEGKGWTTATAFKSLAYYYFEHLVWKKFERRLRAGEFDIVHRITPLSPTTPSLLATKCRRIGVPFILGPLNGGVPWPSEFDYARRAEREWLSYVRGAYKLLPGYRSTRRDASAIIIGSRDTWRQMPERYHHKCVYIPENAIDPQRFTVRRTHKPARPIRVVFLGRLVPYKGADMLIEAAAPLVRAGAVTLTIYGDGPEMPHLRKLIASLDIETGVELPGWIEHGEVQHRLAEHDVFAFPSIREFGGAVPLEAMAVGLVPVVMNYGGTGELVTPDTGYLVDMGPRDQIVAAFRRILESIVEQPESLKPIAERARHRVFDHFTWDAKAAQVLEVYRWVLGDRDRPSDFVISLADGKRTQTKRESTSRSVPRTAPSSAS